MEEKNQDEEAPKQAVAAEFKKPVLFGRVGKLPKKVNTEKITNEQMIEKSNNEENSIYKPNPKGPLPRAVLIKELNTPIPYKEPKWSGQCPDGSDYALEVLKSGMIMEKVELTQKPYYVFGRLANCDVVMAHPTISRHHAVLQYKAFAEEGEPSSGWYLYDLASTHGTYLNKEKLKPNGYTRVRVGHQIKFGTSSRTYILLGPDFDCEGESDLTVTEIKKRAQDMKLDRDRMIAEVLEQREKDRLEAEKRKEDQGIDWGMGEDAEDEPDLADNPYAATGNEELYLEDPKKTLRGYFEREGHELTYNCEERAPGQFLCRVELPMDDARGKPVVAEVLHTGKKKESVIACAMEACRILDRAGVLRQAKHESRRRKERDWSADDYYDSDDDTFLDRTGSVERKRTARMRKHGADTPGAHQALTYDDLLKQISEIEKQISLEEKNLERLRSLNKPEQQTESEIDALDEYMTTLGKQGQSMAQKAEISQTKLTIKKLNAELSKTQKLAELARPAHLPPLLKKGESKMAVKIGSNSVVYGKRIKLKEDAERHKKIRKETKQIETEFVEEVDSDEEHTQTIPVRLEKDSDSTSNKSDKDSNICNDSSDMTSNPPQNKRDENITSNKSDKDENIGNSISKRVFGPMRPPENYIIPESYFDQETDRDLPEIQERDNL